MEENHTHNCQVPPIPQINPGIKNKYDLGAENVDNEIRREIFQEIETSDPENIALMTSNITLDPGNYIVPGEIHVLRNIYKN